MNLLPLLVALNVGQVAAQPPAVAINRFELARPVARAERDMDMVVELRSEVDEDRQLELVLDLPAPLAAVQNFQPLTLAARDSVSATATVRASASGTYLLRLTVRFKGQAVAHSELSVLFLPAVAAEPKDYIPPPQPVHSKLLVGAHHCPLWEADRPEMWNQLLVHPERTPALGFYDQANPQVADWETKWASEHGIDFFIYCWYRTTQGGPVTTQFSSAIHDGLFHSRYETDMKWTIMWENQSRGKAGVADEADLFENLLPFWIQNYFKRDSYLKIDGKPVLFIYRPEFLVDDLGGEAQAAAALARMREECRKAGFEGLWLLGEYRGLDAEHLKLMARLGLDYTFAYVWYVGGNPTPQQAIDTQLEYLAKTQQLGILPQVATVSQAWSGWRDEGTIWKIPPADYRQLLQRAVDFVGTLPAEQLGSRVLLLDNWNEWGEGHYIAPYREYGFGYLDAVREVIVGDTEPHTDYLPEDLGLGPYDTAYTAWREAKAARRRLASQRVFKPGAPADGLIGWWSFDEPGEVVPDVSGHRLGAIIEKAGRTAGVDGQAMVCDGGWAVVEDSPLLSPPEELSVECWVKSEVGGQGNTWMVNRVLSGATDAGYRLGILEGKPCFEVPQTEFSHHLSADIDLPLHRWVHLAGTFDGQQLRIYVDGVEHGSMARPGPPKACHSHLVLGNYETNHAAYFHGLLDEVRLWDRCLSATEVAAHASEYGAAP